MNLRNKVNYVMLLKLQSFSLKQLFRWRRDIPAKMNNQPFSQSLRLGLWVELITA